MDFYGELAQNLPRNTIPVREFPSDSLYYNGIKFSCNAAKPALPIVGETVGQRPVAFQNSGRNPALTLQVTAQINPDPIEIAFHVIHIKAISSVYYKKNKFDGFLFLINKL